MNGEFPAQHIMRQGLEEFLVPAVPHATGDWDAIMGVLTAGDVKDKELHIEDHSSGPDFCTDRAKEGVAHWEPAKGSANWAKAGTIVAAFDEKVLCGHGGGGVTWAAFPRVRS